MTFEDIYEAELPYLWHTLRRLGVAAADREDLAHDVFMVLHRRLGDYDRTRPLRAWLFGIAYRVVADHRRRARVRLEVVGDAPDEPLASAPSAFEALAAEQQRERIVRALGDLDLERRAVLILHDLDGQSIPDIAAVMELPKNTLYSHLGRARRQVAAALERMEGRHE